MSYSPRPPQSEPAPCASWLKKKNFNNLAVDPSEIAPLPSEFPSLPVAGGANRSGPPETIYADLADRLGGKRPNQNRCARPQRNPTQQLAPTRPEGTLPPPSACKTRLYGPSPSAILRKRFENSPWPEANGSTAPPLK